MNQKPIRACLACLHLSAVSLAVSMGSAPVLSQPNTQYFAMVAVRDGSTTTFLLHNPGRKVADVEIEIRSQTGELLESSKYNLGAQTTRRVEFGDKEGTLEPGWAKVASTEPVLATELLRTGPTPWVGVLPSRPTRHFKLFGLVGRADGLRTGVALANPSPSARSDVLVILRDKDGREFRRTTFGLDPLHHQSGCLDDMFQNLGRFEGTAEFRASSPVIAMSVRSDKDFLSLLPVMPLGTPESP